MPHLLIVLQARLPVHVTPLQGHTVTQLTQVSISLDQRAWRAWGEAGKATTLQSRGRALPSSKRSQQQVIGTGQLRQGMTHMLMLLKAWRPGGR